MTGMITHCYNPKINALTGWDGIVFMRVWRLNGTYFGLRPDGIYQLAGDSDGVTPIAPTFTLSQNNLDTDMLKRLPLMRIDTDAALTVGIQFDDGAEHSNNLSDHVVARRVKLGRGAHGRNVSISMSATVATNFIVRSIELYPEPINRGVK